MSASTSDDDKFDLQTWNERANAALLVEIQTLAIASLPENTTHSPSANRGVGNFSIMTIQQRRNIPIAPSPIGVMGPRLLRTVCFAITSAIINDLPPIIDAAPEERMPKFAILVAKAISAAAGAGLAAKALEALEQSLVRNAKMVLKLPIRKAMSIAPIIPVYNAFNSLWYYIASYLTSSEESAQELKRAAAALWSSDSLVSVCATTVVAIATTTIAPCMAASAVVLGMLEAVLYYALESVVELIIKHKNEQGGWWAWLRMWILPEEPRAWSSDEFDEIEMQVTEALRCPISHNLVVDPVIGPFLPNSRPHVYERAWLYRHLKSNGKDPLTMRDVTALDYKYSHLAAQLSTEIAHRYGAILGPL